jgi:hypothetical protein
MLHTLLVRAMLNRDGALGYHVVVNELDRMQYEREMCIHARKCVFYFTHALALAK